MKNLLLISFSLLLCLAGCSRHCPDFNEEILRWFPYKINDTISLKIKSDTVNFIVNYTYLTHTEKYKGKCGCDDDFGFTSTGDETKTLNFNAYSYKEKDFDISSFNMSVGNNYFPSAFYKKETLTEITIDSMTYHDLLIFSGDSTCPTNRIWKMILAKNKGIVAL